MLAVAVCVTAGLPPVPLTVNVYVPLTLDGTVTRRVEELVAGFGLKLPLAPEGSPRTERLTAELNPPEGVIVTV
jgi:hypothetical protein